jgi:4-carboxymuconolactone decarboxylase
MSHERMPPLDPAAMSEEQKRAAQALAAGPRGGVKGPFIPLLRSPQLMDRLQKVGEYLRFHSGLEPRVSEFVVLVVSRRWTQQFEWAMHAPLALKAGVAAPTVESLAAGRRPIGMARDEEIAHDLCDELWRNHGVSDGTYRAAVDCFGEPGLVDLLGLVGYFTTVSMVMNVARTPPPGDAAVSALASLPS